MKLSQLINENISMDDVKSQPFLEDFEGLELYHSTPKKYHEIQKFEFRFREKPQTTLHQFHDLVNHYSMEKFGIPIRNLLFCYNEPNSMYGFAYKILPVGTCKLFYAPGINDMTINYSIDDLDSVYFNQDGFIDDMQELIPSQYTEKYFKELFSSIPSQLEESEFEYAFETLDDDYEGDDDYEFFKSTINDSIDKILKLIHKQYEKELKRMAVEYVNICQEITPYNIEEITDEEIMVYAPNGFYVIPYEKDP